MQPVLKKIEPDPVWPEGEDSSQRTLATTEVSPRTARFLSIGFVVILCAPALIQLAGELAQGKPFAEFRNFRLSIDGKNMRALERAIEEASVCKQFIQPRVQIALTVLGRAGNDQVTIGRDGWLYLTDGLKYSYGRPLLDNAYLAGKTKTMVDKNGVDNPAANPLPALTQLADDCRRWGIKLILVPIAEKGVISPQHLGQSFAGRALLNPDFDKVEAVMKSHGADVVTVEDFNSGDPDRFLKHDTHWAPGLMRQAATAIGGKLANLGAKAGGAPQFELARRRQVSNTGDLVRMLGLPDGQKLFPAQTIEIEQVVHQGSGAPVQFDAASDVLMLGDSFTNIYSAPGLLHWGESAGLPDHVSYLLNKPVDVIAINGSAANGVRVELARAAKSGRLNPKKWIVYEFGMRTLLYENWPVLPLGPPPPGRDVNAGAVQTTAVQTTAAPQTAEPPKAVVSNPHEAVLSGRIAMLSRPMNPATANYPDGLLFGKIEVDRVLSGAYAPKEAIVVFWVMRDHKLLPASKHSVGERVTLRTIPLNEARKTIRSMQRSDDTQDFELNPLFVLGELP